MVFDKVRYFFWALLRSAQRDFSCPFCRTSQTHLIKSGPAGEVGEPQRRVLNRGLGGGQLRLLNTFPGSMVL
jgi:hypothetical protein